jgi:hypothetical protein
MSTRNPDFNNEQVLGYDPKWGGLQGTETIADMHAVAHGEEPSFIDPKFGQLDTSGLPTVNKLREAIENPDDALMEEALTEAARHSSDPDFKVKALADVADRKQGREAEAFVKAHPDYEPTDSNYEALTAYIKDNDLPFTAENLAKAYDELLAAGELELPEGTAKILTDAELLTIARAAQAGKVADAIGMYLHFALPDVPVRKLDEIVGDPAYLDLCNAAVYFVFVHIQTDYADTDENRDWFNQYIGSRPVTVELLQHAWKERKREIVLAPSFQESQPTPENVRASFEAMDSQELEDTFHAVANERARQFGR